jgi:hypothetical protein
MGEERFNARSGEIPGLNRPWKNSLDEGDGLQPVRINVKINRLQPLRVLLSTEKHALRG